MKINKMNEFRIICLVILILFFIPFTLGLGVTPARTTINFEPGLHKTVNFSVINSEHKDMVVVIFVRGELNDSVVLSKKYEVFKADEEVKSFSYEIRLPEKIEKPGLHKADIVVLEMPREGIVVLGETEEKTTFISTSLSVVTQLYVHVPYPNKYAEFDVNVIEDKSGKVKFILPVINRGKLDIVRASARIDIYTSLNEKVATIDTDEKSIKSLERGELYAEWEANVPPGKYRAVATLNYDGETANAEKVFSVGEMLLEIERIFVKDFTLGEIAKFNILASNKWSEELKDAYVELIVYNEEGQIMADIKSANYDIPALSKKEIIAYWDTAGVKVGTYDGKLILKYADKKTERKIKAVSYTHLTLPTN